MPAHSSLRESAMSKNAMMLYSALGHAYFHMFTAFYFVIVLSLEVEWRQPYHELINLWTLGGLLVGVFAIVAGWLGDRWSAAGMLVVYFFGMGLSAVAAAYADSPLALALGIATTPIQYGDVLQCWVFLCRLCVDLTVLHLCLGSYADVAKFVALEGVQLEGAFLVYPVFQVSLTHTAGVMNITPLVMCV